MLIIILALLFAALLAAFSWACVNTVMGAAKGVVNAFDPLAPPPVPPRPYSTQLDEPDETVRYLRARKAEREAIRAENRAWNEDLERRIKAKYK